MQDPATPVASATDPHIAIYFAAAGGVVTSVVLPLIRPLLPKPAGARAFWDIARPYLATGAFSLIVAVLLVALANNAKHPFEHWYEAFIAGYLADSTLQKTSIT